MKKIILCGLLFLFATSVFADTTVRALEADGTDYFAKAKTARIAYLESLIFAINGQLHEMVADKVATGKEMSALAKSVENFNTEQAKAVETYKDIQIFLDPRIKELVDLYTAPILRHGARNQERMSYLLAELTGADIQKIGEDFQFSPLFWLVVMLLVAQFLSYVIVVWLDEAWGGAFLLLALMAILFMIAGFCGA